jgi:hypothetical protein
MQLTSELKETNFQLTYFIRGTRPYSRVAESTSKIPLMAKFRADFEHKTLEADPKVRYIVSDHKRVRCHGCWQEEVLTGVNKTAVLRQFAHN